ncbi:MAG TPA: ABC transporter substrate-binding protein [Bauldia sp.]|nr:ABC transporter substrate-binding protein [Bauldia sp.]
MAAAVVAPFLFGTAAVAATPPDVLVIGHVAELQTLDPAQAVTISDYRILSNIYEGLLRYKEGSLDVEPALATAWKVSDDGKTYTFTLRQGVKFHDGGEFDADAVKFNFDRVTQKDAPFADTGPFPFVFELGPITSTEVIDKYTVALHLSAPYAPMLTMLASSIGSLAGISPAAVKQYGKDFARHGGGTGPFKLKVWESNRQIALEANADYWGGAPKLKGVVFRPIVDDNARVSEMLAGGIDLTIEVPPDMVATFGSDARFRFTEQQGPHLWYLLLNTRDKPFDDKRVRQAANYAINKQALVDQVLKGTATVAAGPTPPAFTWAHDDTLSPYPYDPAKAKALLAAAGYPDGVDVTFYVPESGSGMLSPVIMGSSIQADLAAVGIRAKIQTYEWNTFLGSILPGMSGKANLAELSFMSQDPDMHPFLALKTGAPVNAGYYSNPEVDALVEQGRTTIDPVQRAAIYKKMQQIVYDDAPWVYVANWKQNAVVSANVKGFALQPSFLLRLDKVSKE